MKIKNDTFVSILVSHITTVPEQGGILREKDGKIVAYYHDKEAATCSSHAKSALLDSLTHGGVGGR